jgi:hypothetical protein
MATGINVTQDTPRDNVKVQGFSVTVAHPYAQGHKLRANEADALNNYYVNCIRNAVAPRLKKHFGDDLASNATAEQVQIAIGELEAEYDFGQSGYSGGDPVEKEALQIAKSLYRNAVAKKYGEAYAAGMKARDISQGAKESVLDSDTHGPKVRDQARKIVEERNAVADIGI